MGFTWKQVKGVVQCLASVAILPGFDGDSPEARHVLVAVCDEDKAAVAAWVTREVKVAEAKGLAAPNMGPAAVEAAERWTALGRHWVTLGVKDGDIGDAVGNWGRNGKFAPAERVNFALRALAGKSAAAWGFVPRDGLRSEPVAPVGGRVTVGPRPTTTVAPVEVSRPAVAAFGVDEVFALMGAGLNQAEIKEISGAAFTPDQLALVVKLLVARGE